MTRQDWFLLLLGPCAILLIWICLPWGKSEAWRAGGESAAATAELVGYAFEAPPDGRPLLLGRSEEARFRLHSAPVAPRAAWLTPPSGDRSWSILPARAGLTLRLLDEPRQKDADSGPPEPRVRDTSVRIWRQDSGLLSRLLPTRSQSEPVNLGCGDRIGTVRPVRLVAVRSPGRGADAAPPGRGAGGTPPGRGADAAPPGKDTEPETVWLDPLHRPAATHERAGIDVLACPDGAVWSRPHQPDQASGETCSTSLDGWSRVPRCWFGRSDTCVDTRADTWGARVSTNDDQRLMLPWSESSGQHGFWLSMSGPRPRSIQIGITAGGEATKSPPTRQPADALTICPEAGAEPLETVGTLELRDGDLMAIGRTRFLVRAQAQRLELHHVRDPEAPGYFRTSAGHQTYHPNRRAVWHLPPCAQADEAQEMLTLAVEPKAASSSTTGSAAQLAFDDRERQAQIAAAIRDHGIPHELPSVDTDRIHDARALLSLCSARASDRALSVRLVPDSATGIRLWQDSSGTPAILETQERTASIGSRSKPKELLVDLDGNLLRIAPTAGPRITRRTRAGLATYLIFILCLQAWPLTRARMEQRRRDDRRSYGTRPAEWPANLGTPTLQQLAGIAIASLLFLGTSFHLLLGLHPDLVGKPDYLQAFLQGTVAVCLVLATAAGFSSGRGLERRLAATALSTSVALLGAGGWWWLDGVGDTDGSWLSAWRDQASAAAGAKPEAIGRLLFAGGGLGIATAAVLFFGARLRWSRMTDAVARLAVRVPLVGFIALATAGLVLGVLQRSALAFELALLAGLAWYAAVYWAFVRHERLIRGDGLRRKAAARSMASGLLMLLFLAVFFFLGADLPDAISFASVIVGLAIVGFALRIAWNERSTSLLRVVRLWIPASVLGMAFASFVLTDMGSVAAWLPALLTGFFLWLVRPEEIESRREEPRKALSHLLLALGSGLVLLGLLDVFKVAVEGLDWQALERPQQRLALAEDISYITAGEWITQVRWLASQQDDTLQWVPNVNSDIAIFGVAANLGFGWAVVASLILLGIAGCAALAADQALREARAVVVEGGGDRLRPVLYRSLGLTLGMVCVLLICQWLVHLATGVVLHLPITGLVFPWISHGNTTHLLYAVAILLPMAAVTALGEQRR